MAAKRPEELLEAVNELMTPARHESIGLSAKMLGLMGYTQVLGDESGTYQLWNASRSRGGDVVSYVGLSGSSEVNNELHENNRVSLERRVVMVTPLVIGRHAFNLLNTNVSAPPKDQIVEAKIADTSFFDIDGNIVFADPSYARTHAVAGPGVLDLSIQDDQHPPIAKQEVLDLLIEGLCEANGIFNWRPKAELTEV